MDYIFGVTGEELIETFSRDERIILVDVCPTEFFRPGLISGAINLPWNQLGRMAEHVLDDRDAEIMVFSSTSGDGAAVAASVELHNMGYTRVRYFRGDLEQLAAVLKQSEKQMNQLKDVAA